MNRYPVVCASAVCTICGHSTPNGVTFLCSSSFTSTKSMYLIFAVILVRPVSRSETLAGRYV